MIDIEKKKRQKNMIENKTLFTKFLESNECIEAFQNFIIEERKKGLVNTYVAPKPND